MKILSLKLLRFNASLFLLCLFTLTTTAAKSSKENIFVGEISAAQLTTDYPGFNNSESKQTLDQSAIQSLSKVKGNIHLKTFLGTWCHDSEREVPRLIDVLNAAHNENIKYSLFALDRNKHDPDGHAAEYKIKYTPTIIVERDGVEIGRIVEKPKTNLEQDLQIILK